jgi:protein O-GlcNAc transferase
LNAQALPIVIFEGSTMRGRHSAAILRMMGVTDTVATTIDEYVAIAARLGQGSQYRHAVSSRMAENRHKIYRDRSPVTALENFIERAIRGSSRV